MKVMKKKWSHTKVYLIAISLLLLLINASLGGILTMQSSGAMQSLIRDRMLDISNTAADMIDGNILGRLQAEDAETPEYKQILETLAFFQENIDLKYIYCVRNMGNKNFVFTVDPAVMDPSVFGEKVVYTEALYRASMGHPAVDRKPYTDRWGRFYSAYSPVFDDEGKVSGIVAVDFSADWYEHEVSRQIRTTLTITLLSLAAIMLIAHMISSRVGLRYRSMMNELDHLSDGIESLAKELPDGGAPGGLEILHRDHESNNYYCDDVQVIEGRIRSLQDFMTLQLGYVRSKAYVDSLTGVENRTAYMEFVHSIETRIKNHVAEFSVAMFDINGLKDINDHLGHDRGDTEIVRAAGLLKQIFAGERIFRIGGDEFVAITRCTGADAEKQAENIRNLIAQNAVIEDDGSARLILSMGFAEFDSEHDFSYRDTFECADKAMYEDKKAYYARTKKFKSGC